LGGGAAGRVFLDNRVEVLTPDSVISEVEEYIPYIAGRKGMDPELLRLTLASLPVQLVNRAEYESKIKEAEKRIGERDPDDVELVALALGSGIPAWSNENDLEGTGIEWYTTAELLRELDRLK
jgi:predicted nucleic acid-binding protein